MQNAQRVEQPRVIWDSLCDDEYPSGCWMCGYEGEDQYLGDTPEEARAKWEAGQLEMEARLTARAE